MNINELLPDLYRLPFTAREWGGGGGSDFSEAGATAAKGGLLGAETRSMMLDKAEAYMRPWNLAGVTALGQLAGLLGLPGYTALDPTTVLKGTPGYQWLLDQGVDALSRYGAASGLSLSGPASRGAMNFGQNLAQTYAWNPYLQSLTGMRDMGFGSAKTLGDWNISTGAGMSQDYQNSFNALSRGQMLEAQADAASGSGSDLWGGLGLLTGMVTAPFGGIGGLIGKGIGSLGGLLGGASTAAGSMAGSALSNPLSFGSYTGMPLSNYMSMFKAEGGPARGGMPHIVGEKGPELFIPSVSGVVIPNYMLPYRGFGYGVR